MAERTWWESFDVAADQVLNVLKKLVHEGNARHVIIKQNGRTIVEFPLTVGVIGTMFAPFLAAGGALAAVVSDCTFVVERTVAEPARDSGFGDPVKDT